MRPLAARVLAATAVVAASASGWSAPPTAVQASASVLAAALAAVAVSAPPKKNAQGAALLRQWTLKKNLELGPVCVREKKNGAVTSRGDETSRLPNLGLIVRAC